VTRLLRRDGNRNGNGNEIGTRQRDNQALVGGIHADDTIRRLSSGTIGSGEGRDVAIIVIAGYTNRCAPGYYWLRLLCSEKMAVVKGCGNDELNSPLRRACRHPGQPMSDPPCTVCTVIAPQTHSMWGVGLLGISGSVTSATVGNLFEKQKK
jgi:hypothetical protein